MSPERSQAQSGRVEDDAERQAERALPSPALCWECGEETRPPRMNSPRPEGICYACWRKTDHYREHNRSEKREAYETKPEQRRGIQQGNAERYRMKARDPRFLEEEAARKRESYWKKRGPPEAGIGSGSRSSPRQRQRKPRAATAGKKQLGSSHGNGAEFTSSIYR